MKGNEIKSLRLSVGQTQKEFGNMFGITGENQGQIEKGIRKPSALYILKLMKKFNLSLEDMIKILNLNI